MSAGTTIPRVCTAVAPAKQKNNSIRNIVIALILFTIALIWMVSASKQNERDAATIEKQNEQEAAIAAKQPTDAEAAFNKLTPAEHLKNAVADSVQNATPAMASEGLHNLKAIPASAPEFSEAKRLEPRLVRRQRLALAKQLIEGSTDVASAAQNFKQANALLSGYPNDPEAQALMRLGTKKGQQIVKQDDERIAAESKSHPQPEIAFIKCESAAEQNLKAPSTANFASYTDSNVIDRGSWKYSVRSYVDAENSFGAKLRTQFSCSVKCVAVDQCSVSSLKFAEPE